MTLSTLSSNLDANHKLVNDAKPPDSKHMKLVNYAKPLDSKQMTHANPLNSNFLDCSSESTKSAYFAKVT